MKNFQSVLVSLPSLTYAAGGQSVIRLRDLPTRINGRIAHLKALHFAFDVDPTFTTAPTVVGHNAIINRLTFNDGMQIRFSQSGNALRQFERYENGGNRVMEALTSGATTVNRHFHRTFYLGPPNMAGAPTDFVYPCGALLDGDVTINWGALTDVSADCTALTVTGRVTAELILLDEIRIPPFYERQVYTLSGSDSPITGEALVAFLALANSASWDAFTTGDVASLTVDTGSFSPVQNVDARSVGKLYNASWGNGSLDGIIGDLEAATDTQERIVNLGTATAFAAQANDLQPVLWIPRGGRISKISAYVASSMRLRWGGANGSGTLALVGRFLPQNASVVDAIARRALSAIGGRAGSAKIKTLEDKAYSGPYTAFMPWAFKLPKGG